MKKPPIVSHKKSISARKIALLPTPRNLSRLVSIPRAVMAMVSTKVSIDLMIPVTPWGRILKELNPARARNQTANQGIVCCLPQKKIQNTPVREIYRCKILILVV